MNVNGIIITRVLFERTASIWGAILATYSLPVDCRATLDLSLAAQTCFPIRIVTSVHATHNAFHWNSDAYELMVFYTNIVK